MVFAVSMLAVMLMQTLTLIEARSGEVSIVPTAPFTVLWDANDDPVSGYRLLVGTTPGVYTDAIDVGQATSWQYTQIQTGVRHYVAVSAYTLMLVPPPAGSPVLTPPGRTVVTKD